MDTRVKIKTEQRLIVKAPYNTDFINGAKDLGGVWDSNNKVWIFDVDIQDYVEELVEEVFTDNEDLSL